VSETQPKPAFFTGLDLGRESDFTALAVVEKTVVPDPDRQGKTVTHLAARHLQRFELGTPYPKVVDAVVGLFAEAPLSGSTLVIDETGVGAAVVDMFRAAKPKATLKPFSITSGLKPSDTTVPKKDLVGAVQAALQTRRLKIAEGLLLAGTLAKELENFRVKITPDRNETYANWRERDHDDLVLALALPVWLASRPRVVIVLPDGRIV
jgi:hypothetical protein